MVSKRRLIHSSTAYRAAFKLANCCAAKSFIDIGLTDIGVEKGTNDLWRQMRIMTLLKK